MKNQISIFVLLGILLASLSACFHCEEGSGEVKSITKKLSSFDAIEINVPANIYIRQSDKHSIEIKANESLLELTETEVSRKTLTIETKKCIDKFDVFDIHISLIDLDELEINGSGSVSSSGVLKSKKLEVILNGSGEIELNINSEKLISEINGSGEIRYKGITNKHNIEISGSGDVKAYKLKTENADINISGSGDCKVNVSDNLDAKISGSGNIYYKGNLQELDTDISGSGKVISD